MIGKGTAEIEARGDAEALKRGLEKRSSIFGISQQNRYLAKVLAAFAIQQNAARDLVRLALQVFGLEPCCVWRVGIFRVGTAHLFEFEAGGAQVGKRRNGRFEYRQLDCDVALHGQGFDQFEFRTSETDEAVEPHARRNIGNRTGANRGSGAAKAVGSRQKSALSQLALHASPHIDEWTCERRIRADAAELLRCAA